jgi:hypothetical protein
VSRLPAFAIAVLVFQNVPAFIGEAGTWLDLVTPFAVVGTAAWALRGTPRRLLVFGILSAIAYVDGHGIHLSANDIHHFDVISGRAEDVRHFWDERWGHIEWHLGWLGLLAALALTDATRLRPARAEFAAALLIGCTLFTNTVEGQDWFLTLGAAVVFTGWALRRPTRGVVTIACATLFGAALIGLWAAWHGGVPQFSELGWL